MLRRDEDAAAGSDANAVAAPTSATNATAALRAAAPRADPLLDSAASAVMSGRRAVISRSRFAELDRVCALTAQDGAREGTDTPLGCSELAGQSGIKVRGGEPVADQSEGGNSHDDGRASVYPGIEYALRRVDLGHGDQGDRIAGQDGAVRPVAVQETADIDAEPEPTRERDDEQLALLGEQPGDRKRRDHPDDGAEDAVEGLLVGLSARLQARMPTVTAAEEALSSCSQNAAYRATIMAAQIRSANAQAESGNPAKAAMRRAFSTRTPPSCSVAWEGDRMEPRNILLKGLRRSSRDASWRSGCDRTAQHEREADEDS